jgi:hypothetical protein
MFKLNFIHAAEHAHVSEDGKVSIINIFDRMYAENIPALSKSFFIVVNGTGDLGKHTINLRLVDSDNDQVGSNIVWGGEITEKRINLGQVLNLGQIYLKKFGDYFLEVTEGDFKKKAFIFKLIKGGKQNEK